ncbi:hypothetical protein [Edaphovirga cremea]|uniref:hypothetical protein n=1 Tax=Edaphovirga cremea TaxID=2267246 RepID=UPI001B886265|nr:hypothetical protein [Edaphovirga cremea]
MTIAEKLRLEGEQRGIQKGRMEGMQLGELKGREVGREEGLLLGKLDVARNLLKMGMSRDAVLEATGLSEDELAQIRH